MQAIAERRLLQELAAMEAEAAQAVALGPAMEAEAAGQASAAEAAPSSVAEVAA